MLRHRYRPLHVFASLVILGGVFIAVYPSVFHGNIHHLLLHITPSCMYATDQ
jgi:hypothetical protein